MWRESIQRGLRWIRHVIRQPLDELDRWQRAARFSYDLGRYGIRQLREDRAPQMASALAYQSLFAMVPVLVVAMIVIRGIVGVPDFLRRVDVLLESAGLSHVTLTNISSTSANPESITLQKWLEGIIGQAGQVDLRAVGWVGFGIIIYSAISILVTIENSFNTIYRTPEGRPWGRRVPLYWFLLTASPLVITLTAILHGRVEDWAQSLAWGHWFVLAVGLAWSVSVSWVFWFAVYSLVPNTTVDVRKTAIGALVCVILLEIGKRTLGAYMSNAFTVNELYSSLGLIPLFMFWVYVMWLVVLFGLEVSATLQFLGDRALEEMETRRAFITLIEPSVVVTVMQVVGEDFRAGLATTQRRIADRVGIPERTAASIIHELCATAMLHHLERDPNVVCLAKPPEQIMADRLLEIGYRLADGNEERWIPSFVERLRKQEQDVARELTLASLLPAK